MGWLGPDPEAGWNSRDDFRVAQLSESRELPSEKSARVAERRHRRNVPLRSRAKTFIGKARRLIAANELDAADQAVTAAVVALDKAAQKGAMHPNHAARRKSRLVRHLARARRL